MSLKSLISLALTLQMTTPVFAGVGTSDANITNEAASDVAKSVDFLDLKKLEAEHMLLSSIIHSIRFNNALQKKIGIPEAQNGILHAGEETGREELKDHAKFALRVAIDVAEFGILMSILNSAERQIDKALPTTDTAAWMQYQKALKRKTKAMSALDAEKYALHSPGATLSQMKESGKRIKFLEKRVDMLYDEAARAKTTVIYQMAEHDGPSLAARAVYRSKQMLVEFPLATAGLFLAVVTVGNDLVFTFNSKSEMDSFYTGIENRVAELETQIVNFQ